VAVSGLKVEDLLLFFDRAPTELAVGLATVDRALSALSWAL
jgi:hypothetical protein